MERAAEPAPMRTAGGFFSDGVKFWALSGERRKGRARSARPATNKAPIVSAAAPATLITFLTIDCLLETFHAALN